MPRTPTQIALARSSPVESELQEIRGRFHLQERPNPTGAAAFAEPFWTGLLAFDDAINLEGPLGRRPEAIDPRLWLQAREVVSSCMSPCFPQANLDPDYLAQSGERRSLLGPAIWRARSQLDQLGLDPDQAHSAIASHLVQICHDRSCLEGPKDNGGSRHPTDPTQMANWILRSTRAFPSNEIAIEIAFGEAGTWLYRESLVPQEFRQMTKFYEKSLEGGESIQKIGRWISAKLSLVANAWNFSDETPLSPFAEKCLSRSAELARVALEAAPANSHVAQSIAQNMSGRAEALLRLHERHLLDRAAKRAESARAKPL